MVTHLHGFSIRYLKNYTTSEGLSQSQVTAITEDQRGFVWIGTMAGGVNRLDGVGIRNREFNKHLKDSRVYDMLFYDDRVWVATGTGVYTIDSEGIVAEQTGEMFRSIQLQKSGKEVYVLRNKIGGNCVAALKEGGVRETPSVLPEGASPQTFGVREDGTTWIGTSNMGLFVFKQGKGKKVDVLKNTSITSISPYKNGVVVATESNGVFFVDADGKTSPLLDMKGSKTTVVYVDREGAVYVGTEKNGFFIRYANGQQEHYSTDTGIPSASVQSLFQDSMGNIWVGFSGKGVVVLPPIVFVNFTEKDKLGVPFTVIEPEKGKVLLGGIDGFSLYDKKANKFSNLFSSCDDSSNICSLKGVYTTTLFGGRLLIGTKEGLFRAERKLPYSMKSVPLPDSNENGSRMVYGFADYKDDLLLNTRSGVYIYDGKEVKRFRLLDNLNMGSRRFIDVEVDTKGNIYLLTMDNEIIFVNSKKGSVEKFNGEIEKLGRLITKVSADDFGSVWFGSKEYVLRYDTNTGKVVRIKNPDDRIFEFIYFIYSTSEKRTWIGTNRGIYLVEDDRILYNYNRNDGLAKEEANTNAVMMDSDGDLWFGLDNTAAWMRRGFEAKRKSVPPKIFVQDVKIYDEPITVDQSKLILNYDQNYITFSFISPSPSGTGNVSYLYMLKGLEHKWSKSKNNELRYTNVPPGEYEFMVKAVNRFGVESGYEASLPVYIRPPFWATKWFRTSLVGFVMLLVLYFFHRAGQKRVELERKVSERTEQLRREIEKSHQHLRRIEDLKSKFERLSTVDELTGLYNRRFFFERMEAEVARLDRFGGLLGILILDVDKFKDTNDTYGHLMGDRVLKMLADILRQNRRKNDVVARYGGEEFVMACQIKDREDLRLIGERVRDAVETFEFKLSDELVISKTVSIGGAIFDSDGKDIQTVLSLADKMLYTAKEHGRNRLDIFDKA